MADETFLGGRVRRRSLPVYEGAPEPGAPALKRLNLPQGELAQIGDSEEGFRFIAWVELRVGGPRGNHYHHRKKEWVYLLKGELELVVEDRESKERASLVLTPGDLAGIEAGVAHAFRPLVAGEAIEFSPARFDPADTVRYRLI